MGTSVYFSVRATIAGHPVVLKAGIDPGKMKPANQSVSDLVHAGLLLDTGTVEVECTLQHFIDELTQDLKRIHIPFPDFAEGVIPKVTLESFRVQYHTKTQAFTLSTKVKAEGRAVEFFLVTWKQDEHTEVALGFDFQTLDFASVDVPLLKGLLAGLRIQPLVVVYASAANPTLTLPASGKPIPLAAAGMWFSATLYAPSVAQDISLQLTHPDGGNHPPPDPGAATTERALVRAAASPPDKTASPDVQKWFTVQKSFGPLQIRRLGVAWKEGKIGLLFDAAFSLSVLTIGLDDFRVYFALSWPPKPSFELNGLDLTYNSGPVSISGGFLASGDHTQFAGQVLLQAGSFSLSAMGAYQEDDQGHTSVFIFAMLGYPLGGPAFFFVTGLAAGFGYNSRLNPPTIDGVANYALVQGALPPGGGPNPFQGTSQADPMAALKVLQGKDPPDVEMAIGEYWLAAGVRFTSFEMIQSFVLLSVSFGTTVEVTLLGISHMYLPEPEEPVAYIEIVLEAVLRPQASGTTPVLAVEAKLTPASYVLSRDCHLTGGFAFYIWANGDFVVTLGGYHPSFKKPDHYPSADRLGVNWPVDSHLSIKGGMYFCLTPAAMMAGGALEATWQSGSLKAWFSADANFIIYWQPFQYEIDIDIHLGVSFVLDLLFTSVPITIHIGVGLALWGPPFGGEATIDLDIISFTISFGGDKAPPQPIPWSTFKDTLLPHKAGGGGDLAVLDAQVAKGLIKQDVTYGWVVNPQQATIAVRSAIPASEASLNGTSVDGGTWTTSLGIPPVGTVALTSKLIVKLDREGTPYNPDPGRLTTRPILGDSPAALWNPVNPPDSLSATVLPNTLVGFQIAPKPQHPDRTQRIPLENLLYETDDIRPILTRYLETSSVSPEGPKTTADVTTTQDESKHTRKEIVRVLAGLNLGIDGQETDFDPTSLTQPPVFQGWGQGDR